MKYWKEKESNAVENMQFWQGTTITKLAENEIFVMGTNPLGIHGAGAAKAGLKFGAKMRVGRGLVGATYGLITKNLEGYAGFLEKETGIIYDKEGYCSVSPEQIKANIDEMYDCAKKNPDKKFLITYQYETWPNGNPKKSLNGYTSQEMFEMFVHDKEIPPNIIFHDSYQPHLKNYYQNIIHPFHSKYLSDINYKEYCFFSVEHFVIFSKAKNYKDEKIAEKIIKLDASHSQDLKSIEKEIVGDEHWNVKKEKIYAYATLLKFLQNEHLRYIFNSEIIHEKEYSNSLDVFEGLKEKWKDCAINNNSIKIR